MLGQKRSQLKTSMDLFETSTDANTEKFAKELERKLLPSLFNSVQSCVSALNQGCLATITSDAHDMLVRLETIRHGLLRDVHTQSTNVIRIQKTMGLPVTATDEIERCQRDLELKQLVWTTLREWRSTVESWRQMRLNHVDVSLVEATVESLYRTTLVCEHGLPANDVVQHLKDTIEHFKDTVPILADLRYPHLRERHWKEV
jgi:hypothetical protein